MAARVSCRPRIPDEDNHESGASSPASETRVLVAFAQMASAAIAHQHKPRLLPNRAGLQSFAAASFAFTKEPQARVKAFGHLNSALTMTPIS